MRRRASLQARTRAAKMGRALKCGAEPGRGGASGEGTGRWAEATANGLACGSRGLEAGRQWPEGVWAREIAWDMQQACARGGGLTGVHRPCGGKGLGATSV